MAIHKVTLNMPALEIGKSDVSFSIRKDSSKIGELRISNDAAVWFPANNSYGYKLSWQKLAELFEEYGTHKAEKR